MAHEDGINLIAWILFVFAMISVPCWNQCGLDPCYVVLEACKPGCSQCEVTTRREVRHDHGANG